VIVAEKGNDGNKGKFRIQNSEFRGGGRKFRIRMNN
jgi:hypothetical protein